MTEQEIQKLFKEKLNNRSFDFNPSNWEAMEKMLNARRKRRFAFYRWASAAIVAFGLTMAAILYFATPYSPADLPVQTITRHENGPASNSTTNTPGVQNEESVNSATSDEVNKLTEGKEPNDIANESEALPAKTITPEKDQRNVAGNGKAPSAAQTAGKSDQLIVPTDKSASGKIAVSETGNVTSGKFPEQPVLLLAEKATADIPVKNPAFNLVKPKHFTPAAMQKFLHQQEVFVAVGTVLRNSYTEDKITPGLSFGLGYRFSFTKNWSASLAVNYSIQKGVGLKEQSDSTFFSFGKEIIETNTDYYRFDYLEFPLNVSYDFNAKNSFEAGGYVAFLTQVGQKVETRHYIIKHPVQVRNEEFVKPNDHFASYDWGFSLGYFYRPLPQLSIGIEMKKGFTDITLGNGNVAKGYHTNFNTRIGIRYTIF